MRSTVARAVPGSSCRARHRVVQALRMHQTASASLHLAAHLVLAESPRSSQLARSCTRMAVCRSRNLRAGEGPWSGAGAGLASKKRLHAASGSCMRLRTRRGRARRCCPPAQKVALVRQAGNAGAPGALGIVIRDACTPEQQGREPLVSVGSCTSLPCTAACAALPPAGCGWVPLATATAATADLPPCKRAAASSCTAARPGGPSRPTTEVQKCSVRHRSWGWWAAPWQAHRSARRRFRRPSLGGGACLVSQKHWCPRPRRPRPCPGMAQAQRAYCRQLVLARACGLDGGRRGGIAGAAGQDSPGDERRVKACALLALL